MLCTDDQNSSELCHLVDGDGGLSIAGRVLAAADGSSHELRYEIRTDDGYRTTQLIINRLWPEPGSELAFVRDSDGGWRLGKEPLDGFEECFDVDLGFSPSTNTLPIRRLGLEVGERHAISVLWILFPQFSAVRGEQSYERVAADRYVYESGDFRAVLGVNEQGVVLDYEGLWVAKAVNTTR
jgi:uncharacterized protein